MPSSSKKLPAPSFISEKTRAVFAALWQDLEAKKGAHLSFPKLIFWLNGAPGAGKGTHLPTILKACRLSPEASITMSDLLDTPEDRKRKAKGLLIDDKSVLQRLFEALQDRQYIEGVVVDGFPRTKAQSEYIVLLFEALKATLKANVQFYSVVLQVDPKTSIERQLLRGKKALQHNASVLIKGKGPIIHIRETDIDPKAAEKRYEVFEKETLQALKLLESSFPTHFIEANQDLKTIEGAIIKELSFLGKASFSK